ncbi:MAG: anthranilate synthase component I [Oscillospiraceae bacterium]|nr:anthranilate synthase component I [Oscillospiraceae bacterium]
MLFPLKEEVRRLLTDYKTVPVFYETLIDSCTPVKLFAGLKEKYDNCFILESVDNSEQWGRYSFIGINPKTEIKIFSDKAEIIKDGISEKVNCPDPIALYNSILSEHTSPVFPNKPKLTGGLIGYFGYDTVRSFETKLTNIPEDDLKMPDSNMFLYDEIVAYDHLSNKAVIILNINSNEDIDQRYDECYTKAHEIAEILINCPPLPTSSNFGTKTSEIEVRSNCTKDEYMGMVEKAKDHIKNGDISQVVLSQRFEIDTPPNPFDVYRMLRSTNPSPYLYFFDHKDYCFAGASPEMLVSVNGGIVVTKPIAGTMPRGKTEDEDKAYETKLIGDPKEKAEHTMLVDLGRNDIGRVCKLGTVNVTDFMRVEHYSKVMHLVSDVQGELDSSKTAMDALMSVLPAGTLSGAPKVRAMQIIDDLENKKRGLYGGTVGYLSFSGNIDTCIAIRTVLFKNDKAYVQAGAGIVYDSVPESEYEETRNKALAVINAVQEAAKL